MENDKMKYPEWQAPLQDVILEFNLDRLPGKIQAVEALIFHKLQQLRVGSEDAGEKQAIDDALEILLKVKRERLQFPEWKQP
jgi:hypothetical protein